MTIKKNLATLQRAQDKQTLLIAFGDLSITGLTKARRSPRPEVSTAAERLMARVGPRRVLIKPSFPALEWTLGAGKSYLVSKILVSIATAERRKASKN